MLSPSGGGAAAEEDGTHQPTSTKLSLTSPSVTLTLTSPSFVPLSEPLYVHLLPTCQPLSRNLNPHSSPPPQPTQPPRPFPEPQVRTGRTQ